MELPREMTDMGRVGSMGMSALMIVTSLLLLGSSLTAQTTGSLVGTVMDASSGAVLEGATASVVGMGIDDAVTDADGRFLLPHLPAGRVRLRIALSGYSSAVESIDVSPTEVTRVRVLIPRVDATMEELLVMMGRVQRSRTGAAVAEVRRRGNPPRSALDLLKQEPGVVIELGGGTLSGGARIRVRGSSSFQNNDPAIYVDGVRIDDGQGQGSAAIHVLELIPAEQVERIQILRGASGGAAYADAVNGVFLIETRRGGGSSARS